MLQKFLFIGVGGSGGKTLRIVRSDLEFRLEEAGYDAGIPAAWQFLQLDVPVSPDGNDPDLPGQLPAGSYVGLAARNLTYRDLDRVLDTKGGNVTAHTGGWRPDPREVNVPPAFGAGQYRAVGRVVAAAAMEVMVERLRRAVRDLTLVDVNAELEAVSRALGVPVVGSPPPPTAIIVSSIAGGAGAGFVLDVCDVLRMLGTTEKWLSESVGILYTPDVFDELPAANRAGVNPNALGALNELLSGYWHNGEPTAQEFALLEASGLPTVRVDRRGPRYPFVVGKSNGRVTFTAQNDVYRAVGKSLAAWAIDPRVQDRTRSFLVGNWASAASNVADNLGISRGKETPLCSLGYSSVSLGRDRFLRYASQRLARHGVDRLLRGHHNERVPEEQTPEAARDESASEALYTFLEHAGLRELGPDWNQIVDAIRGGEKMQARNPALTALTNQILTAITSGRTVLESGRLVPQIISEIENRKHKFLSEQQGRDRERAEAWVETIQEQVLAALSDRIGQLGGEVGVRLVELTVAELKNAVVPELHQEADVDNRLVSTTHQRIHGKFANFEGQVLPDNPLIREAVREGVRSLWAESEVLMLGLTTELIKDLCDGFLLPLRDALKRALEGLRTEEEGQPGTPSQISKWPHDVVPERLYPAENEVLLEPVDSYPARFLEKVRQTLGMPDALGAQSRAVRQLVSGVREETDAPTWIQRSENWVPRDSIIKIGIGSRKAKFDLFLTADDLLQRAMAWVREKDTAIGDFVRESLRDYLDPKEASPSEHDDRMAAFNAGFNTAVDTSAPLVQFDQAAMHRIHERATMPYQYVMTPIPFPRAHPARDAVRDLLLERKMDEREIEDRFGDSDSDRIEISTFLAAPVQPVVISSLMGPIISDWARRRHEDKGGFWRWRRARPLGHAVPVDHETLMSMIRGWFVARMLNQIQSDEYQSRPTSVFVPEEGFTEFPFPFLGPSPSALDELLPALLESLPLALFEASTQSLRLMTPYRRLCELGEMQDRNPEYSSLSPVLLKWIREGTVQPGAPEPRKEDAGLASDDHAHRVSAVLSFLERYVNHYDEETSQKVTPESSLRLNRTWELRNEILAALSHLRDMAERERRGQIETGIG